VNVPRCVDDYAALLTSEDWDGLAALLREDVVTSIFGVDEEHGRAHVRRTSLADSALDVLPGQHVRVAIVDGEPVVLLLLFTPDESGDVVRDVIRIREDGSRITHVAQYWYCPEVVIEVARSLGLGAASEGSRRPGGPLVAARDWEIISRVGGHRARSRSSTR
jgi:RNA polymerase sigma-70 factor, ECF subfamily